ncbi:MAG: serine/threonine phosphatase [Leptolyngbyaceae cyanobacterium bins.302]|nr:serine/threonine phosphatase [Leptolyngbyaceae cyanobacterium bins.302]
MLICPQCQFENPTANNFCQQCGVSLTQNTCVECGNLVPFEQLKCPKCGAVAGVVWWAIVSSKTPSEKSTTKTTAGFNGYLDLQQRYQIVEPFPLTATLDEQQGKILDCQPFQLSVLESLVVNTLQESSSAADFSDPANRDRWVDAMDVLGIPPIAYPYISLNNQFYQALPAIHNAWQSDQQIIFLLEDRSEYPSLMSIWQDEQNPVPLLQLLQWFYEMVELWQAMELWNCQHSLLTLSNLRVDADDQILCLQRLYFNPADSTPALQDLQQVWTEIVAKTPLTFKESLEPISQLLTDIDKQLLTTPEAIQERIETIAQVHQTLTPAPDSSETSSTRSSETPFFGGEIPTQATELELDTEEEEEDTQLDSDEMPTIVLPMQLFSLEEVGRTDVGRQREHNEDYFGIETQVAKLESPSSKTIYARNLYILCDGMGGHAGGEVASALAVDTIRNYFKSKWQNNSFPETGTPELLDVATMTEAVLLANKAIYDVNQENACSGSGRMGTTLVMVLIHNTDVAVAHVGDSRLYRYTRKRGLEQITVDHEVGQREIQRGVNPEVAYSRPDAYQLTQALGPRDANFVKPDVQFFELAEDMLLLLCSDGLTDNDLLEKHLESHVQPLLSSQANLDKGVSELIDLANQYNGHDNVTTIAIRAKVRPCLEHLR